MLRMLHVQLLRRDDSEAGRWQRALHLLGQACAGVSGGVRHAYKQAEGILCRTDQPGTNVCDPWDTTTLMWSHVVVLSKPGLVYLCHSIICVLTNMLK